MLNERGLRFVRELGTGRQDVYFVIGSDGNRYGPVPIATLEQWVDQNRIIPQTLLVDAASGDSVYAHAVPALNAKFASAQQGYQPNQPNQPGAGGYPGAVPPGAMPPGAPNPGAGYNPYQYPPGANQLSYASLYGYSHRTKLIAILLAIFLGPLGVHRFYLGYHGSGLALLLLTVLSPLTCFVTALIATVWTIADIVMIATGSLRDAEGRVLPN